MALMAVRKLELCKPIKALCDLEGYQGVRLYCYLHGHCLGYFDLWHNGRQVGRERLIHEISVKMWEPLARRVFAGAFREYEGPWSNIQQLVTANLKLAPEPEDAASLLTVAQPPAPLPALTASITIPTRDRPEDLARCLDSLTGHVTQVDHEIIVVDNNPASGITEPVVRRYPGVIYLAEPRPGVTYARNAGALHAQGDIIVCTDDDVLVEEGWLDNLIRPFASPDILAVSGLVMPYELDQEAQILFEEYGGLTKLFVPQRFDTEFFKRKTVHADIFKVGVTANCAIRASVFADPAIGPFDNGLEIAEDPYMFYRILKAGGICYFEPTAPVRHNHRDTRVGLRRQLYNYGRSFTSMELRALYVDKDKRALTALLGVFNYQKRRILNTLSGRSTFPLDLILMETWGHIVGPFTLLKTVRQARRLGSYTPAIFQQMQAARLRQKQIRDVAAAARPAMATASTNSSYTRFIILARARTGSNFLRMLLNSHSDILCMGEIFNEKAEVRKTNKELSKSLDLDDDPIEYLDKYLYREYSAQLKAIGFKLLDYQAQNDEWKAVWEYLRSSKVKIIHLKRRNLLDRYLSLQLAFRSDVWVAFEDGNSVSYKPIILDPQDCFQNFHNSLYQEKVLDDFFSDNPKLEVIYEDLCADLRGESRRVQAFLGVEFQQLSPETVKLRTQKKSETIANYTDLKQQLIRGLSSGKKWAKAEWLDFFDDE